MSAELYGLPPHIAEELGKRYGGQQIPVYMREPIAAWIMLGRLPGDFLRAVIRNDFKMAVFCADEINGRNLRAFAAFFHNGAPQACQGSAEAMEDWSQRGGLSAVAPNLTADRSAHGHA